MRDPGLRERVQARFAVGRDLLEIVQVEQVCFPDPWGLEMVSEWQRRHNRIIQVVERGDRVVAHMVFRLLPESIQLVRLAVLPECRRQGIAEGMLHQLGERVLAGYPRRRVLAVVPEDNVPSQFLLRKAWYRAVRVLRQWEDGRDAYRFVYQP
jgi:ribosomal protein S18 acetylase RimI-like enzyme